ADRAYDIPPFLDRCQERGWQVIVRCKANSALHFRDHQGREQELRQLLRQRVRRPDQRWKGRGQLFKKAGWRTVSIVAVWARGETEPLVVLSTLAPRWDLAAWYGRRFWSGWGFGPGKSPAW